MTAQPPKTLQEMNDEFHMMVGECVTQWATVEELLFRTCRICLACTTEQAAIVYYRTPTIAARIELIDELLGLVLPPKDPKRGSEHHPDTKEWSGIKQRLKGLLSIRNRLAHEPVTINIRLSTSDSDPVHRLLAEESSFAIYASRQQLTRAKSAKLKPLLINDLKEHLVAMSAIAGRLQQFYRETLPMHITASPQR